jgi:glycosyltransferase involved in cell wall biosynthesis
MRAAVVFDMHENMPKAIRSKPWIPAPLRGFVASVFRAIERALLSRLWVVFAESSYAADYPQLTRTTTVLNYPQLERLSKIEAMRLPRRNALVYLGAISADRGCYTMLRALEALVSAGVDVTLELIGSIDPDCRQEVAVVQSRVGDHRVRYHGILQQDDAWKIAAECRVGLALLRDVPNYVDSYPTKIFEYMALGLPVICSDFPLYRRVVGDAGAGLCVAPDDTETLVEAIRCVITDEALAHAFGANARRIVYERYDWMTQGQKLLQFYDRILGRRSDSSSS